MLFPAFAAAWFLLAPVTANSQIYEPEGLNMPGAWDSWTNPPTVMALASSTQVTGGKIIKIPTGTVRWQTTIKVAATGGDVTAGTYEWLFTSGPATNYFQNKWAGVNVTMNTLQLYTKGGSVNNSIILADNKWYTMNWEDIGYADNHAIFMETSAEPVSITNVSVPASVLPATAANIDVTISSAKSAEEHIFLRYTVDAWATSAITEVTMSGATTGNASIPGQPDGTIVSFYVFSSTLATVTSDYDMVTIKMNNNSGANFTYPVGTTVPGISFANLQWPGSGQIYPPTDYMVFGQALIPGVTGHATPAAGLQAWVGYSTTDTNPNTWTNWIAASFSGPAGNNDEFKANLGTAVGTIPGRYYYATRFQYNADPYVYGGYSDAGGGYWDGGNNHSGVLDVIVGIPETSVKRLYVFPNPVGGDLTVQVKVPSVMTVTDLHGKMIVHRDISTGISHLDFSGVIPGTYLVEVTSATGTDHLTIIKK